MFCLIAELVFFFFVVCTYIFGCSGWVEGVVGWEFDQFLVMGLGHKKAFIPFLVHSMHFLISKIYLLDTFFVFL